MFVDPPLSDGSKSLAVIDDIDIGSTVEDPGLVERNGGIGDRCMEGMCCMMSSIILILLFLLFLSNFLFLLNRFINESLNTALLEVLIDFLLDFFVDLQSRGPNIRVIIVAGPKEVYSATETFPASFWSLY